MIDIDKLIFYKMNGLLPAVVVDNEGSSVLMVGFMNQKAVAQTVETGKVTFYSRSKKRLWTKGETSGNFLIVNDIMHDCDNDTLLIKATQLGNTCHLGNYSCFEGIGKNNLYFFEKLFNLIKSRKSELPEGSYTTKLFNDGLDRIAQKVGEEAVETVIAAKNDDKEMFVYETSDLIYHLMVLLVEKDVELNDILKELIKRHSE